MEEQIYPEQQEQYYYPPAGGSPNYDGKADLLDKIKPEKAVEVIKQILLGREWDETKGKWIDNPALQRFKLTDFGATMVSSLVYPASSQNTSLSNLKEERIHKRLVQIIKALCKDMLDYQEEMGIKSQAQMYHVANIVYTHVWVSLTQSENEGIRRLLNSTISESRNVQTIGQEKKGGVLGLFRR
jgi:hypothetical protein